MKRLTKILLIITIFMMALSLPNAAKADSSPISELYIYSGENALENLENSGLMPVEKNLNPTSGVKVYLGYRTGGEPITDLLVSNVFAGSLEKDGITYRPVSGINLNEGAGGTVMYLYYTRDPKAGTPILSLHTLSDNIINTVDLAKYLNDGSDLLRMENDSVANLEEGVSSLALYMDIVHENIFRPYIKEVKLVKTQGKSVTNEIFATGFNYYMEAPIPGTESDPVYIAYDRTADPEEALTMVFLTEAEASLKDEENYTKVGEIKTGEETKTLYVSKDKTFGTPICDLSVGRMMAPEFSYADWVGSYFNGELTPARAYLLSESAYRDAEGEESIFGLENKLYFLTAESEPENTGIYVVASSRIDGWNIEEVAFEEKEDETEDETEGETEDGTEDETEDESSEEEPTDETEEETETSEEPEESSEEETEAEEETEVSTETEEEVSMEDIEYETIPDKDPEVEILYDGVNTATTPEFVGSAIGAGSLVTIACFLFAALLLSALGIIVSMKKKRGAEK